MWASDASVDQRSKSAHSSALSSRITYDARVSHYDESWHPTHALNYTAWTLPQPGQHILDLACGTYLVAITAKHAIGPTGTVIAVEIGMGIMAVGMEKARKDSVEVRWVEGGVGIWTV